MRAHVSSFFALLAVASLALIGCDYPRPSALGGHDSDAATNADDGDIDGRPLDAAVDAEIDAAPGSVSVVMTPPSASSTLGTTTRFNVKLTSNNFAGTVNLAASGGPSDWTRNLPPSVTIAAGEVQNLDFDVVVATNGSATASPATLTVSATISTMSPVTDTSTLMIANEYILPIAGGVGAGPHWGALTNLTLRNGSRFTIRNDDAVAHQIHAQNTISGLAHQATAMNTGESYSVVLGSTGTDAIYCHVHTTTGQINITSQ